jgi:hypothetical protein
MQPALIQLLLPIKQTPGNDDAIATTRAELVARYAGVTAYARAPARGAWLAPDGKEEHDDLVMVEVLVDDFDPGEWQAYKDQLAKRFGEKEIHLRALRTLPF